MSLLLAGLAALALAGRSLGRLGAGAGESRATRAVRAALGGIGLLVLVETALGACGHLDAATTTGALAVVAVGLALGARRRGERPLSPRQVWTIADGALAAALGAAFALRLWAGLHKQHFLYDALSYHLHVPATWLHDRRLEIVPAVFGDPAPAYAPSNLELAFLFVMAPIRSDYLAGCGQLPFAALAVLAIAATVREAGGRREAALGAALAFLLVPEIWQQAPTAMTDLGMAALLLACLPFVVRLRLHRARAPADLLTCAAALGIAVGTKYVAAILALPFALAASATVARPALRARDAALAVAVAVALGGYWFARNALSTGNPFYPVAALGFPGPYGRAAMRAWDYHWPVAEVGALGAMWTEAGLGFVAAVGLGLVQSRPRLAAGLTAALAALFWLAVPYQESRFLFPAFGTGAIALGLAAGRGPAWLGWGGLALATGGAVLEFPTPERLSLAPAAALGALATLALRRSRLTARARRLGGRATAALALGALALALGVGLGRYRRHDPVYVLDGGERDRAWAWLAANVRGARIAYAGTNLAFPLAGLDLNNYVSYVNVAGQLGDRLHDFDRRRAVRDAATTAEPAFYRDGADPRIWLANLRAARAEILFVAPLEPIVARNVAADDEGFPVERAWADQRPELFELRYASPAARIYGIRAP